MKQDYEVSRDESAFVLKSEFYTHRSDTMEQVVAWVQGRDGLEPALEDRLKEILGETAREQGLKTIEYSASPRLVSGLQGIEARANYQSKGQSITMRSILFRKAAEAWHVTLYFVRGNQEAEKLANEIFDSVKIELVEPQKHVQE